MAFKIYLQTLDYIVLGAVLIISMGIGVLFAVKDAKKVNRVEYLLGGRSMAMVPVACSIVATFLSGVSLLGTTADVYVFGAMAALLQFGIGLSSLVMAFTFVPLLYPLRLLSFYEYFQLRFESNLVRMLAVVSGMLKTLVYMAVALLTPALVLETGVGLPMWLSVGMTGIIATVYTSIGGIKSVIWTDVFQLVIILVCVLTIIIKGCLLVGGPSTVWDLSRAGGRASFDRFSLDPRVRNTWWTGIIAFFFTGTAFLTNQSSFQRVSAMKSMRDARKAMFLVSGSYLVFWLVLTSLGLVAFAYFSYIRCDPIQGGLIKNNNQLYPYYVMSALNDLPGIGGVFLAMIFSGTLSTLSSGINSLAAITTTDIMKRPLKNFSETSITIVTKLVVLFYGILIIALSYGATSFKIPLVQMSISFGSCFNGPVCGLFLLGAINPKANKIGAIVGAIAAATFNLWLVLGQQIYGNKPTMLPPAPTDTCILPECNTTVYQNNFTSAKYYVVGVNQSTAGAMKTHRGSSFFLYDVSYEWYGLSGIFICFMLGTVVSYLTRKLNPITPKPSLMFPVVRRFCVESEYDPVKIHEENTPKLEFISI